MAISQELAAKLLSETNMDVAFWCNDGTVIKSVKELEGVLRNMDAETFLYHANDGKNDFSNWVKDVFGDHELAEKLKNAKSSKMAAKRVGERIKTASKFSQ